MEFQMIDRPALKQDARDAMRAHRPSIYLVTIVFLLITAVLDALSSKLQFPGLSLREIAALSYNDALMQRAVRAAMQNRSVTSSLLSFAITLMDSILTGGFLLVCLRVVQRVEAGIGTLFDLFGWFFRFLWLEIVTGFFILLWSLLLVIPGIVAAYRYSMANYIFFDDPEKGALQCIRESKAMMQGHKGELFVLHLSFLGWILLSVIPLVSIFTLPYMNTTVANFYRVVSGQFYSAQARHPNAYGDPWNR